MKTNLLIGCSLLALVGCDYSGDRFYGEVIPHVPGVLHLGNEMEVYPATTPEEIQSAAIFAKVNK